MTGARGGRKRRSSGDRGYGNDGLERNGRRKKRTPKKKRKRGRGERKNEQEDRGGEGGREDATNMSRRGEEGKAGVGRGRMKRRGR